MAEILRSRTFGELFSQTFTVFFKCLGRLIALQVLFWVPIVFLVGVGGTLVLMSGSLDELSEQGGAAMVVTGVSAMILGFAMILLSPLPNAVAMIIISDHLLGQSTPFSTAFLIALKKLLGLIAVGLIYVLPWILPAMVVASGVAIGDGGGLIIGLGVLLMLAAFVVSVMLFATFFVAGPVLVLEQVGPGEALRRSRELTRGYRWTVLGLFFVVTMIAGIAVNFLGIGLNVFTMVLVRSEVGQLAGGLLGNLVQQVISGAGGGVVTVVLYFDLRVKKDGFDIENLAELVDVIAAREGAPRTEAGTSEVAPSP
jgi:hypothetical protein